MANSSETLLELNKLDVYRETLSRETLLKRVVPVTKKEQKRSLEQIIIALKILMLNDMRYEITAREVCVTRKTLWTWWQKYGSMMKVVKPSEEIAKQVENNLAGLMLDVYAASKKAVKKMEELTEKANSIKDLQSVAYSLRAYAELIKAEADKNRQVTPGTGEGNYFMNVYNQMIVNKYGKQD